MAVRAASTAGEVLVAVSTSRLSCKRAGKTRTLMPIWDSSGESRVKQHWARRRELGARPGADFGELVLVKVAESGIEVAGVLLPGQSLG